MQLWSDTLRVLRGDPEQPPDPGEPAHGSESELQIQSARPLLCAKCEAAVTATRYRISVAGSHEHRFMNPAGLFFHIGCFAEAIGCTVVGPDSLEYPWFVGFAWRYAMCANCACHLGWHFRADGKAAFFGLILDRLVQPHADA
jgi:hypothetical protein